ncbi:hypothetical protein D9M70_523550 [compost metagenome]
MVLQRRAAGRNGIGDDLADRVRQAHQAIFGLATLVDEFAGGLHRRQTRAPERLADIDIAETGDVLLIEQGRLQRLRLAGKAYSEIGGIERVSGRLLAKRAKIGVA